MGKPTTKIVKQPNVICIDKVFYDADQLAAMHPGGDMFVLQSANRDGTSLYNSSHRKPFDHAKYKAMQLPGVTSVAGLEVNKQDFTLYFELCKKVQKVISSRTDGRGFAPTYFFGKAAFLLSFAVLVDIVIFAHGRTLFWSIVQGFLFALIGLGIQHDSNHGSVSRSPTVNRLMGMSQDFIGGSTLSWVISHNTDHHIFCNDAARDPDLVAPTLRLTGSQAWGAHHQFQQWYLNVEQFFFGLMHITGGMMVSYNGPTKAQRAMKPFFDTQKWGLIVNLVRLLGGFLLEPTWHTVFCIVMLYGVGGFYLAFFFFISHNYDGVEKSSSAVDSCFLKHQVETSSNVCGWLLGQVNGGLNYQIEHHLFPRLHSTNYHHISPIVRAFCESKGIRYTHFSTLLDNSKSVFRHMELMGRKPSASQ